MNASKGTRSSSKIQPLSRNVDFLLLILGVLCIGYSTSRTADGYRFAAGGYFNAWILAIIISLGLVILNLRLKRQVEEAEIKGAVTIFLVYLFLASFSIVANFNAFYSDEMRDQILYDNIESYRIKLVNQYAEASIAIDNSPEYLEKERIEKLSNDLKNEINGLYSSDIGVGDRAMSIISQISPLIEPYEIFLSGRSARISAREIDDQIKDIIDKKYSRFEDLKTRIARSNEEGIAVLDSAIAQGDSNLNEKVAERVVSIYNDIGSQVNGVLGISKFDEISFEDREIGRIGHTLKSVRAGNNNINTTVALFQSILIDLATPFLIFFFKLPSLKAINEMRAQEKRETEDLEKREEREKQREREAQNKRQEQVKREKLALETQERSAYYSAKKENTSESYDNFMIEYPSSQYIEEIQTLRNERFTKELEQRQKEQKEHEKRAYLSAKTEDSIMAYDEFELAYPNSEYVNEARHRKDQLTQKLEKEKARKLEREMKLAYDDAMDKYSIAAFKQFLIFYPNYPEAEKIRMELEELEIKERNRVRFPKRKGESGPDGSPDSTPPGPRRIKGYNKR